MKKQDYDTPFQNNFKSFSGPLSAYDPFPGVRDRSFHIPDRLREDLIKAGEENLPGSYEAITARDYMSFVRTGDRSAYEEKYFSRRHRLNALITAETAEGNGRFLDDIIDGIYIICEESTWVLPAHNTYIRDTPQIILPDTDRPVLDLFACETAALLSMTYYLFKDKLDTVSELICKRIFSETDKRLITPYLNDHFWWMGDGDEPMCNWTPWCTQNVLLSAFLLPFDNDIRTNVIRQAAYSLDCFIKDYGEDGCCDEGAQYYRHAGLCLFHCIDILNRVTGDAFRDMWSMPKIRNIASYIVNVHACGEYYVNFSDCSAKAGRMGVREFLFGKECHLDALMEAAAEDASHDFNSGDLLSDESLKLNLFCRMLNIAHAEEVLKYHEDISDKPHSVARDIYYPSVGIMVARSTRFVLAAKAGDNADNHNHNDTGSFILYMDGKPLFVDIGVETYSRKTFSEDRYEIWTMQSGYHNLPTIAELDQKDGEQYRATEVICDLGDKIKTISMHIEKAYPLPDRLSDNSFYIRNMTLDASEETFTLTDTTGLRDVVLNFITYEPPMPTDADDTYMLGNAVITFKGAKVILTETLPITDARLKLAWDHDLYRTRLRMENTEFVMRAQCKRSLT